MEVREFQGSLYVRHAEICAVHASSDCTCGAEIAINEAVRQRNAKAIQAIENAIAHQ